MRTSKTSSEFWDPESHHDYEECVHSRHSWFRKYTVSLYFKCHSICQKNTNSMLCCGFSVTRKGFDDWLA